MNIISEIKKSKKFIEGKNFSLEYCNCEKCKISRYRHTHEPKLADPNHSYWNFLRYCVGLADTDGIWMEFGVGSGKSISFIAKNNPNAEIYGFDSFLGLPEDWIFSDNKIYKKETYSRNGIAPKINFDNITLVEGMFDQTLPNFCKNNNKQASFIHIDCDLYSSTQYVLEILYTNHKIKKGTIILFDEFYNYQNFQDYEYKAFIDFVFKYKVDYEWIAHTESFVDWNGNQVALKIK